MGANSNGTQLAYQRGAMAHLFSVAAVIVAALGAQHVYRYMNQRKKARAAQRHLDVWEGEGGSVPTPRRRRLAPTGKALP